MPGSAFPSSNSSEAPPPVEQCVTFVSAPHFAAAVADRAYVIERGSIRYSDSMAALEADEAARQAWLSV